MDCKTISDHPADLCRVWVAATCRADISWSPMAPSLMTHHVGHNIQKLWAFNIQPLSSTTSSMPSKLPQLEHMAGRHCHQLYQVYSNPFFKFSVLSICLSCIRDPTIYWAHTLIVFLHWVVSTSWALLGKKYILSCSMWLRIAYLSLLGKKYLILILQCVVESCLSIYG